MKTIIVYYSYTGTTKKYVEKMQEILNCDLLEIKPKKDIKVKGFAAYVVGGLKVAREKQQITYKGIPKRLTADLSGDRKSVV